MAQYEHVQDMLAKFGKKIDRVILLTISEAETIKRLSTRKTCTKCGEVFNTITRRPKTEEVCDECGGTLSLRDDDKPEAIKRRLAIYHTQTMPIIDRAKSEGVLMEINGEQPIENINQEILNQL